MHLLDVGGAISTVVGCVAVGVAEEFRSDGGGSGGGGGGGGGGGSRLIGRSGRNSGSTV